MARQQTLEAEPSEDQAHREALLGREIAGDAEDTRRRLAEVETRARYAEEMLARRAEEREGQEAAERETAEAERARMAAADVERERAAERTVEGFGLQR